MISQDFFRKYACGRHFFLKICDFEVRFTLFFKIFSANFEAPPHGGGVIFFRGASRGLGRHPHVGGSLGAMFPSKQVCTQINIILYKGDSSNKNIFLSGTIGSINGSINGIIGTFFIFLTSIGIHWIQWN